MKIPDKTRNNYGKIATDFRAARFKIRRMNDDYIDSTDNKQLFKEMRSIFIDIGQILKTMNGVQRDDDV